MMNAFVSGSQVYGNPTPCSDVDLVVLMSGETVAQLRRLFPSCKRTYDSEINLTIGKLNLIGFTDPKKFQAWQIGTRALAKEAPVSSERAKEVLDLIIGGME